jgi:Fungal potassium channel
LYSFAHALHFTTDIGQYFAGSFVRKGIILTMFFTVVIFTGSAVLLIIAAVMYVPLLCYIKGNLKEYCCHKVDKRSVPLLLFFCFRIILLIMDIEGSPS